MPGLLKVDMDVIMDHVNIKMNYRNEDKEEALCEEDVT